MQVISKKTEDIIPYINNPRNNEDEAVSRVAASINEFGFKNPILVDESNVILAGHTRHLAAKKLGLETVPVIVISDLSTAQKKAYRIADNKTNEYSTWNNELLTIELENLGELNYALELTGLDDWEIDGLLKPLTNEDLEDFFVEKEEKPKEPKKTVCPSCGHEFEQ